METKYRRGGSQSKWRDYESCCTRATTCIVCSDAKLLMLLPVEFYQKTIFNRGIKKAQSAEEVSSPFLHGVWFWLLSVCLHSNHACKETPGRDTENETEN